MYFENYKLDMSRWTEFQDWAEDITEKNAYLALSFVKKFAFGYKEQSGNLEADYRQQMRKLFEDHEAEKKRTEDDHSAREKALDNEKRTIFTSVDSQRRKIASVISAVEQMEAANQAAVSIADYVRLKEQRRANLAEFERLQQEKLRLAGELYKEKKAIESARYENAKREVERQYKEKESLIQSDYEIATERLQTEYKDMFCNVIMSSERVEAYKAKCNELRFPVDRYECRSLTPEYIYIGEMQMFIPKEYKTTLAGEVIRESFGAKIDDVDAPYEIRLPYCQKVADGIGLFIKDVGIVDANVTLQEEHKKQTFEDEMPMLLLRAFMGFPAGKLEAFTIDSGRMGAVFHELLVLGSGQKRIIEAASSRPEDIERKLSTLRSKLDSIANNYGADFEARMRREPFYALAISNFPEGFTSKALKDLSTIVKNASSCGVAIYILATEARLNDKTGEDKIIVDEIMQLLHCTTGSDNTLKCMDSFVNDDANILIESLFDYPTEAIAQTIARLQSGISRYRAVTTTFEDIYPGIQDMNNWLNKDTLHGISIPVGVKGAADIVNITLGASGASNEHHVLVEGSTGVGKTTFLHTLIMSTLISYSPNEVEIYLVDFKAGVEFKIYADHNIPSLKIVSIQSEREFGLQVFKALEEEFERRSGEYRATGATSTGDYREKTGKAMPKVMLIMDEYQELFSTSDDITKECERILNTLILEGRAFGIHIILATQNLSQASLNHEIYKQMFVRIALKGSENVLASDNDGSQMLVNSSAGTTIYNNNRGESGANKVFQTAYLGSSDYQNELLEKISMLQNHMMIGNAIESKVPSKVLYTNIEDNRQHNLNCFIIGNADPRPVKADNDKVYGLYLGETYELRGNLTLGLVNQADANLLVAVSTANLPKLMVNSVVSLLYADLACADATRGNRLIHFVNLAGELVGNDVSILADLFQAQVKYVTPEATDDDWSISSSGYENVCAMIDNTYNELMKRRNGEGNVNDRLFFILAGMDKVDALVSMSAYETRTRDEYAFSDTPAETQKNALEKIMDILRYGAQFGINCIMTTQDIAAASRVYGERFYDMFGLRIAQQLSANYMVDIVREDHAENLKPNTLVFYKRGGQTNKRFRAYETPVEKWLREFAKRYHAYEGGMQ